MRKGYAVPPGGTPRGMAQHRQSSPRRCAVGVLALLATLPLLWQSLAQTPLGTVRIFHFGALALALIGRPEPGAFRNVTRASHPLVPALVFFTAAMTAFAAMHESFWVNPVQNAVYAAVGLYAGACFLTAYRDDRGRRLLVWAAPLTMGVFLVVFGRSMQTAGVNPLAAYRAALLGDRGVILHDVFRVVFTVSGGGEEEVLSQTRHEIYGALLIAACVSHMVARGRSHVVRLVVLVSELVIAALILTSLSRAVILAGALLVTLVLVRMVLRAHIPASAVFVVLILAAVAPFVAHPLTRIVVDRFLYDTQSYEVREGAWQAYTAPDTLSRLAVGGPALPVSTHTMIGDAFLLGGVVAGVSALLIAVMVLGRMWYACAAEWIDRHDPAALAAAGIVGLAAVRAFTSGGGLLALAMWCAVGIAAGYLSTTSRCGISDRSGYHISAGQKGGLADLVEGSNQGARAQTGDSARPDGGTHRPGHPQASDGADGQVRVPVVDRDRLFT